MILSSSIIFNFILLLNLTAVTTTTSLSLTNTGKTESSVCPNNSNNNNMSTQQKIRSVKKILPKTSQHWVGNGFHVFPVFSNAAFTNEVTPFLMFDYAAPKQFKARVGSPLGVGQHPHRGFETVTIAFQGQVEHHDSRGNRGIIQEGDVQWMTAGSGLLHEEYHSKDFTREGGTFEMAQLWVNLPKKYKMTKPRYQAILNENIPIVKLPIVDKTSDNNEDNRDVVGTARIIAGELGEIKGAAKTFSPVQLWDITLPDKGSVFDLPVQSDHTFMLFVRRGSISVGEDQLVVKLHQVAMLDEYGDTIRIRVLEKNTSILVLGGEPINEPIAAQGPFVMNTQDEIYKAISDFRMGKMG